MATRTFLKQVLGLLTEERTVETSAGAGSSGGIPNLNAAGVLDITITNGVTSSAGAGDSGKLAALDGTGRLASGFLPVGVTVETVSAVASEALAAGAAVNLYLNAAVLTVRNADASVSGRDVDGFVLAAFASSATAAVYLEGVNTQLSARTIGAKQYLSASTPGGYVETAPSTAGQTIQILGKAISPTAATFERCDPMKLA